MSDISDVSFPLGMVGAHLRDAAAAAAAVPALVGIEDRIVLARRAAVHAGRAMGLGASEIAALLGVTRRSVTRQAREPADPYLVRAIRMQIGLRERVPVAPDVFVDSCERGPPPSRLSSVGRREIVRQLR